MEGRPAFAEVPAHRDPNKEVNDYVALGKSLRACFVCRLVKSEKQVRDRSPEFAATRGHGCGQHQLAL